MAERLIDWRRATSIAFDAYETAVRNGADAEQAVDVALARARALIPNASDCQVREVLSIELAKRRKVERTAELVA